MQPWLCLNNTGQKDSQEVLETTFRFFCFNLVPRVFSLSNMAAVGDTTLAHSELKRSLIGAFHAAFKHAFSLVSSFQNKDLAL